MSLIASASIQLDDTFLVVSGFSYHQEGKSSTGRYSGSIYKYFPGGNNNGGSWISRYERLAVPRHYHVAMALPDDVTCKRVK